MTDDNYKSFQKEFSAKKNSACIILVTSQNCQDCKQLDNTWAKVAENFENRTDVPITIASMDESLYPALAREHGLYPHDLPRGYIYEEGGAVENVLNIPLRDIEGTAQHFKDFVKGAATNTTAAQLKKDLVSAKTPIVVSLVDNSTEVSKEEAHAFEYAAKTFRNEMKFQVIQEEFLITSSEIFGISENSFVVFMPGYWLGKGQKEHVYSPPLSNVEDTVAWVNANKIPLVAVRNPHASALMKADPRPALEYLTLNKNKKKQLQPFTDILRDVAKKHPEVRCTVDSRTTVSSRKAGHADTPKDEHVLYLRKKVELSGDNSYDRIYPYRGAFEAEAISAFVQDFLDDKLTPFVNAEEEFPKVEGDELQEITASNYKEHVLADGYHSILVLCENLIVGCSEMKPYMEILAKELGDSTNSTEGSPEGSPEDSKAGATSKVRFFWLSPSSNNLMERSLKPIGLPALYFFRDGSKDFPNEYKGDFNVEAMHAFIVGNTELQFFDDDDDDDDEF